MICIFQTLSLISITIIILDYFQNKSGIGSYIWPDHVCPKLSLPFDNVSLVLDLVSKLDHTGPDTQLCHTYPVSGRMTNSASVSSVHIFQKWPQSNTKIQTGIITIQSQPQDPWNKPLTPILAVFWGSSLMVKSRLPPASCMRLLTGAWPPATEEGHLPLLSCWA